MELWVPKCNLFRIYPQSAQNSVWPAELGCSTSVIFFLHSCGLWACLTLHTAILERNCSHREREILITANLRLHHFSKSHLFFSLEEPLKLNQMAKIWCRLEFSAIREEIQTRHKIHCTIPVSPSLHFFFSILHWLWFLLLFFSWLRCECSKVKSCTGLSVSEEGWIYTQMVIWWHICFKELQMSRTTRVSQSTFPQLPTIKLEWTFIYKSFEYAQKKKKKKNLNWWFRTDLMVKSFSSLSLLCNQSSIINALHKEKSGS